jgi:endonuclease G
MSDSDGSSRDGYVSDFHGIDIPLPTLGASLQADALRHAGFRDGIYKDYAGYTLVTNARLRSPIFGAFNVFRTEDAATDRKDDWDEDADIGAAQLGPAYYERNDWDRGHVVPHAAVGWGAQAQRRSDSTYVYSNAVLQHKTFNQDEWEELESWVRTTKDDLNDKVSVVTGPIYRPLGYSVMPEGRLPAQVPSAFFKIVFFRHRDDIAAQRDILSVRAFIVVQNADAMLDWTGQTLIPRQRYQVAIALIEHLTGLEFLDEIKELNPMKRNDAGIAAQLGVDDFPVLRPVDRAEDIADPGTARPGTLEAPEVTILAAMVNPKGRERPGEWVSIANFSDAPVPIDGWKLRDIAGRTMSLDGTIEPGGARRIQPLGAVSLRNAGTGEIALLKADDALVDRVRYSKQQAQIEGRPIVFSFRFAFGDL